MKVEKVANFQISQKNIIIKFVKESVIKILANISIVFTIVRYAQ